MEALNVKERSQAFWKFVLFFVFAVAAILLAVFFNYQVPKKENKILRDKADLYQAHTASEEKFAAAMGEANEYLDSLDKPGANVAYLNQLIGNKLAELTILQTKDNSAASKEDKIFLDIILKYQQSKTKLLELKDASDKLQKLQNDYNQCAQDKERLQTTLSFYQRAGNN
jgi:hypothetical protein